MGSNVIGTNTYTDDLHLVRRGDNQGSDLPTGLKGNNRDSQSIITGNLDHDAPTLLDMIPSAERSSCIDESIKLMSRRYDGTDVTVHIQVKEQISMFKELDP
jgi:hypothetical protein